MTADPSQRTNPPAFRHTVPDEQVTGAYARSWQGPGEYAARLVMDDLASAGEGARPTVLDIGCGGGLMGSAVWQSGIATRAGRYIGVEPDADAHPHTCFDAVLATPFEQAPLDPGSVDLAYAAMVIEHVTDPQAFFAQLARVLRPGGVFWAFTVDRRHFFSWFSQAMEITGIKDRYLDRVRGHKGEQAARYDNHPVHYRCNTPARLAGLTAAHFTLQTWSLHRVGQLDGYVPYRLRRLSHLADRLVLRAGLPGSVLVARLVRR